ncbi:MAG: hypothetical protein HY658_00005, partial [Actinobacteria bacterium]|nr:hypothetical protein [Actinomycetota bacterium]
MRGSRGRWALRGVVVSLGSFAGVLVFAGIALANDTCRPENKGDCRNTAGVIATAGTAATITAIVTSLLGGNGTGKPPAEDACQKALSALDAEIDTALATAKGIVDDRAARAAERQATVSKLEQFQKFKADAEAAGNPSSIWAGHVKTELAKLEAQDEYIGKLDSNIDAWAKHIEGLWSQRQQAWERCNTAHPGKFPSRAKPDLERPRALSGVPLDRGGTSDPDRCADSIRALDAQLDTVVSQARAMIDERNALIQRQLAGGDATDPNLNAQIMTLGGRIETVVGGLEGIWQNRNSVWEECNRKFPGRYWQRGKPEVQRYDGTAGQVPGGYVGISGGGPTGAEPQHQWPPVKLPPTPPPPPPP